MSTSTSPPPEDAMLTIGDLATRTGVAVGTLRAWETRYGFPEPVRLNNGHRRYRASDVARVLDVLRQRSNGVDLTHAVAHARPRAKPPSASVFAGLRARWPDLPTHTVTKRTMLAISRAIEDECCAAAEHPVVIGAFQRPLFYDLSRERWRDVARTASFAAVLAEFPRTRRPRGRPVEVALPPDVPMQREWSVVCDATSAAAVLAGWELPGQGRVPDHRRRFEATWSVDPEVVREATRIGLELVEAYTGGPPPVRAYELADAPGDHSAALRRATALTNRMIAKLDR